MSDPILRRAHLDDAEVLASLGARTFTETFAHLYPPQDLEAFLAEAYSVDRTRTDLANPQKAQWLVERGERPIGYALAGPCDLPHPDVTPLSGELKRLYFRKGSLEIGSLHAPQCPDRGRIVGSIARAVAKCPCGNALVEFAENESGS